MGLSAAQTEEALNLGITPNLALGQTRVGELSHWKGCAYANASRNAVFAALLAQRGLTGPAPVFEGELGFFSAVTKEPYQLEPFGGDQGQPFKVHECNIKQFALGLYSQTVVEAALDARRQVPGFNVADVEDVHIRTLQKAIDIMAGDEEKYHPKTRESADHSMPYATAIALTHNTLNESHFSDEHINDPGIAASDQPHANRGVRRSQPARARGHAVQFRPADERRTDLQLGGCPFSRPPSQSHD